MSNYTLLENLLETVGEIPAAGILSKTAFKNDLVKNVLFGFDAGQELSEHTAAMPAIIHILEGEATLTLGGDPHEVAAGAWVYMPAHLPHSVLAKTPLKMLLLMLPSAEKEQ